MAKPLNILIVEDEAITAENLKQTLLSLGYGIAGLANNAADAIDVIINNKVDLAILDIQIQGAKNGIWLANYIRKTANIPFIFLTAYGDETTIMNAAAARPYGYLLKPFVKQNLLASIQVAITNFVEEKEALSYNAIPHKSNDKDVLKSRDALYIKHHGIYSKIYLNDILYAEADKNYVHLVLNTASYMVRSTLKDVKQLLPQTFVQVHRSFVVNIAHVDTIKPISISLQEHVVPLGNSYKDALFKAIKTF